MISQHYVNLPIVAAPSQAIAAIQLQEPAPALPTNNLQQQ